MINDIHCRLYAIFMDRLVRIWREKSPSFRIERGGFSLKERFDIQQKWKECVEGIGGKMLEAPQGCDPLYGVDSKNGVVFDDPCESPKNSFEKNAVHTYILIPTELAEKILVLGHLP